MQVLLLWKQKDYNLEEVVIKGEKPLVKVEDGRLGYDLSVLSEKQAVSNAYEAITKLPGVQKKRTERFLLPELILSQ